MSETEHRERIRQKAPHLSLNNKSVPQSFCKAKTTVTHELKTVCSAHFDQNSESLVMLTCLTNENFVKPLP